MRPGFIVEINLKNLLYNLSLIKKRVNVPIIGVVKADAYGHGAVAVAKTLIKGGVMGVGVAYVSEAIELRDSGIDAPILVFFDNDVSEDIVKYKLIPVVNTLKYALELSSLSIKTQKVIDIHLNIDTGMGRMGLNSETLFSDIDKIIKLPGLKISGLMTHFPDADNKDKSFSLHQIEQFKNVKYYLINKGISPLCHLANSAAILNIPEAYFDAVRPGIILYGSTPCPTNMPVKPVMTVKTFIADIRRLKKGTSISYGRTFITKRNSLIGILPVGYADGLPRLLSNNFEVIVKGKKAPIIGKVCMDITMVDLTEISQAKILDKVIVIGKDGDNIITADDIAQKSSTISYEILTLFGRLNKKRYY